MSYHKEYYLAHRDELLARVRIWRESHKVEKAEYDKEYRETHQDKIRAKDKMYRETHPDKIRVKDKMYRETHQDEIQAKDKMYRETHPDRYRAYKHNRRARKAGNGGSFTKEEWDLLVAYYTPAWLCLNCQEVHLLTIDHVLPIFLGGSNNIDNIQPLCKSCNSSKATKHIDYRYDDGAFAKKILESRNYEKRRTAGKAPEA